MTDEREMQPRGASALFVKPPQVGNMGKPLEAIWNTTGGLPQDDSKVVSAAAAIDFSLMNDIFENFLEVVGLPVAIIDLDGRVLASSRWQRICVQFHRNNQRTLARCFESDVSLSREMREGKPYAIYRCRNGLTDCATPIELDGVHVANLFIGQFFLEPPDQEWFRKQQEEFGFDAEDYAAALADVPILTEEKLPAILRLIRGLAQQIARHSLAEHRVRASYAAVERQVAERTQELAESHERLRKIADRVPGVVYQFMMRADGSCCVPYVSDAFSAMFEAKPEEVRDDAAKVFAAAHPDDLDGFITAIQASAANLTPWRHEFRIVRKDGTIRWLGGEAQPERDYDGSTLWHGFITDITERKRTEMLLDARLRLAEFSVSRSLKDLLVATLDIASDLTGAETGFFHFLLPDQSTLSLQAWSSRTTREFCSAAQGAVHYDVASAGVWADAVRQRQSVIYNDYASLSGRKGLPEGHAAVRRFMSVPIFRDGRIVALFGLGNKPTPFTVEDVAVVETLADLAWDVAERKRAEEALAERNELVQRRYESLRALNDIAALPQSTADDQVSRALELGAQHLRLPFGLLARVEGDDYTILHHSAPPDAGFADGQVFALGDTFCAMTMQANDVVAIPHVGATEHAQHPCYRAFGLEAYIATPISVAGSLFGTVNFSSPEPYPRAFDEGDLEFMRLLGRWISSVLERQRTDAEILEAKRQAEAASVAKGEFLANMSHEIRTPMTAIIGLSDLLGRTSLSDRQRDGIDKIRVSAKSLLGILNDILDFSKIEAGKLELNAVQFDLDKVLSALATIVSVTAQDKNIEVLFSVSHDVPRRLIGDDLRLQQVLINLVGNAIKFTEHGHVLVRINLVEQRDKEVVLRFAVEDTGIGMSEAQRQRLFQAFSQGDSSTTRRFGGTGLGLVISNRLVALMGGSIDLETSLGQGSTFQFTARFRYAGQGTDATQLSDRLRRLRVLIVDDNAVARDILAEICISLGWAPTLAASGEEAVAAYGAASISGAPFQVVLMDWRMPGMDGIEAAQRLHAVEASHDPAAVVIVITAFARELVLARAQEAGIRAVLTKPVTPSQLLDSVTCALGGRAGGVVLDPPLPQRLAGVRLLLVEDNAISQEVARELLEQEGATVTTADDGASAIGVFMAAEGDFDAVLMDMQMPVMDGLEATRRLRLLDAGRRVPIIAMTANAMTADRERCLQAGMSEHLGKPLDLDLLVATILRLAGGTGAVTTCDEAAKQSQPALAGFDRAAGLRQLNGNAQLLDRMLVRVREDHRGTPAQLRLAVAAEALDEVARIAHTIKGVAANLGAQGLAAIAGEIERAESGDEVSALLPSFEAAFGELLAAGAAVLPDQQDETPGGEPAEGTALLAEKLSCMLGEHNLGAGEALIRLRKSLPAEQRPLLEGVAESIERLDFRSAAEQLQFLRSQLRIG